MGLFVIKFIYDQFQTKYEVTLNNKTYRCTVGRSGIKENKHEGDGATPAGEYFLRKIFYRSDRINLKNIHTQLPIQALLPNDAWCDDVNYPEYNTYVKLPFSGSHEELWRDDDVYDIIVVVGYNDKPVIKNKGSAIFMHIARKNYSPTAGCIAFAEKDLLEILPYLNSHTRIKISTTGEMEFKNTGR